MNKVIGFVMVGTNELEKSSKFYDAVLAHLGMKRVTVTERYIGYGHSSEDDGVKFYITKPHNKENASAGNGTMVALAAETKEAVDKFHKTALENGAVEGVHLSYSACLLSLARSSARLCCLCLS